MNTTMAPIEHAEVRHASLEDLTERVRVGRRRAGGNNDNENKRDGGFNTNPNGGGGGGGGINGNGVNNNKANANNNGNGSGGKKPNANAGTPSPSEGPLGPTPTLMPFFEPTPTTVFSVASSPPVTIVVTSISTLTAPAVSLSSFPSASPPPPSSSIRLSSTITASPSLFSKTSSTSTSTVTVYTSIPDPSGPPRKGLGPDDNPPSTKASFSQVISTQSSIFFSTTAIAESALSAPTTSSIPDTSNNTKDHRTKNQNRDRDGLSPLAEHLLVAAGAIGAFIMVAAAIWLIARMRKVDLFAPLRNRKFERGGSRGWYGWRKQQEDYFREPPPKYSGAQYTEEKSLAAQQPPMDAFYNSLNMPPLATPAASAAALSRANSERQKLVREALLDNSAPFATSPPAQQAQAPTLQGQVPQTFYSAGEQTGSLSRNGTQITQVSVAHSGYNNAGTQQTFQTQGGYDPNQREVNHLSYLSSLSSGFGDGLIIPEPTVVGAGEPRQSYGNTRKFSWMTQQGRTSGPVSDRDTVYTISSIETAPRFRTIHSWVAQQTGRVEKRVQSAAEVPSMPAIPRPLQAGSGAHQRNQSEDAAFQHHPGDEINIGRGSRVPSSILDRKVNVNLG